MGKDTFGKMMPRALDQALKQMGEQIKLARKRRHLSMQDIAERATVTNMATGNSEHFEINGYKKYCLMNALDDIDFLLENKEKIEQYEQTLK